LEQASASRREQIGVAIVGFSTLALEVVYMRVAATTFGGSSYSASAILAAFLLGFSMGPSCVRFVEKKFGGNNAAYYQILLGAYALCSPYIFKFLELVVSGAASVFGEGWFYAVILAQTILALVSLLPLTLCCSAYFILACQGEGSRLPQMYALSNYGSFLGALIAGLFFLPELGIAASLYIVGSVNILFALIFGLGAGKRKFLLLFLLLPSLLLGAPEPGLSVSASAEKVIYSRQGLASLITVTDHSLYLNGIKMCGDQPSTVLHMKLSAVIPSLIAGEVKRAFVLGLGCGLSVEQLLEAHVPSIEVAELDRYLPEAASHLPFFPLKLGDPRYSLHIDDGRFRLNYYAEQSFDIAVLDPPIQNISQATQLYSKEFFELVRSKLRAGGALSLWLIRGSSRELGSVVRTLGAVFKKVYLASFGVHWVLISSDNQIKDEAISRLANFPVPHSKRVLDELGQKEFSLFDCSELAQAPGPPINTDDNMYLELLSARERYFKSTEVLSNKIIEASCRLIRLGREPSASKS